MKAINIYVLTRIDRAGDITRAERQMSGRSYYLKVKDWEIAGLRDLTGHLYGILGDISYLDFFYSFTIPKLGKEFDLLRINDDTVINIELKSHSISDERIKYQLALNRNYLASLGRSIRSYTYISSEDRLVRLSNSGNLIESDWDSLSRDILGQNDCEKDNIEQFFSEEKYLISPLTDPERFLRGSYFLTSQQRDIKKQILGNIKNPHNGIIPMQGFMGLPGTGKTLLLYDIAMELSSGSRRVCVLHFGSFPDEMKMLDNRLKRIDFFPCAGLTTLPGLDAYGCIFVDEGHRMSRQLLDELTALNAGKGIPVIISYDYEAIISPHERPDDAGELIDSLPDLIRYRLTNRIRMNIELSSFISCAMRYNPAPGSGAAHRMKAYPSVSIYYANDPAEAGILLNDRIRNGYTYIADNAMATCREFDKVVMLIDGSFYYDEDGFLRSKHPEIPVPGPETPAASETPQSASTHEISVQKDAALSVRRLFHGLNRAKSALSVIVINNPEVFGTLLTIAQGR
ncbi:MAG: ATP-binding protein [Lachnospiraceae bacterium]|nr:ATP-binding protein [Lachnospiraceae bacterium]